MRNKEFLFIYEAAKCNPNGDPDQENKPRMDWLTKTNLVSDARLKRYIRDYLIDQGKCVFVSQVGGQKVSVTTRLIEFINELENNEDKFNELVEFETKIDPSDNLNTFFEKLKKRLSTENNDKGKKQTEKSNKEKIGSLSHFELYKQRKEKKYEQVVELINNRILLALTRKKFLDIRFFGGAFAVDKFPLTITGPIQINMGFSLHPVELNPSDGIVTIMGSTEGQSDMGKKPGVLYSLIAFTGTINSKRAGYVNFTEEGENNDLTYFRKAIIHGVNDYRSDSKKNQYPKLYLEIEYNDNETYGRMGDLRNLIEVTPNVKNEKDEADFTKVRKLSDLNINFNKLYTILNNEQINNKINKVRIWQSVDFKNDKGFEEEKLSRDFKNKIEIIEF